MQPTIYLCSDGIVIKDRNNKITGYTNSKTVKYGSFKDKKDIYIFKSFYRRKWLFFAEKIPYRATEILKFRKDYCEYFYPKTTVKKQFEILLQS